MRTSSTPSLISLFLFALAACGGDASPPLAPDGGDAPEVDGGVDARAAGPCADAIATIPGAHELAVTDAWLYVLADGQHVHRVPRAGGDPADLADLGQFAYLRALRPDGDRVWVTGAAIHYLDATGGLHDYWGGVSQAIDADATDFFWWTQIPDPAGLFSGIVRRS
jgi:hypothetical protein